MRKRISLLTSTFICVSLLFMLSSCITSDCYYSNLDDARNEKEQYKDYDYLFTVETEDAIIDFIIQDNILYIVGIDVIYQNNSPKYYAKEVSSRFIDDYIYEFNQKNKYNWNYSSKLTIKEYRWCIVSEYFNNSNDNLVSFDFYYNNELYSLCYDLIDDADYYNQIVVYNDETYDGIYDWYPIGEQLPEKQKAWLGYEEEINEPNTEYHATKYISTYDDDTENLFVSYRIDSDSISYYHKRSDELPDYKNTDLIDKIALVRDGKLFELDDDLKKEIISLMSEPCSETSSQSGFEIVKIMEGFKNYPAYYNGGNLFISKSGELTYGRYEWSNYVKTVPTELADKILSILNQ